MKLKIKNRVIITPPKDKDEENNREALSLDTSGSSCCGCGTCQCFGISERERLKGVLEQKLKERESEFSKLHSAYKFESRDEKITSLSFSDLQKRLQSRELSAANVLRAYIAKALIVNDRCNAITDFIPNAQALADELDKLSEVKGPLHGIPVCIKDDNSVEGLDTTHGFVKNLYKPATTSAAIVKVLVDLGAVPFCKTNVPQTLFTYGSDNPVFGTTTNPHNKELSPGGSSSGTGALVGGHGVLFGTGTDIGGSLRIPAHFNGVASIKPTNGRISDKGIVSSLPNLVGLTPSVGIIGQTAPIVGEVLKHLLLDNRQEKYDSAVIPIPWDEKAYSSGEKLRIGYFTSLPFFPTLGDSGSEVERAKEALESLGHTLIPFKMPDGYEFMRVLGNFLLADNAAHFTKCWRGEKVAQGAKLIWLGSKLPVWFQRLFSSLLNSRLIPFLHSSRTATLFGSGAVTSGDLWEAAGKKKRIINDMLAQWDELHLDAMICNVFPFPAPPLDLPGLLPTAVPYTMIWNLVDFPAGVVPFGFETGKKLINYNDEGDIALKLAKKHARESIGAPIGIQVVGRPFREEIVLRLMNELQPFNNFKPKFN